eukprot:356802-Chlamydomonas_euryale.AAC.9
MAAAAAAAVREWENSVDAVAVAEHIQPGQPSPTTATPAPRLNPHVATHHSLARVYLPVYSPPQLTRTPPSI